jgi:hypothetical protein
MTVESFSRTKTRGFGLKEPVGWFAAGNTFMKAISLLSDGAFKLFAYLCLQADRRTGRLQMTHKELADTLGKCKRAIGAYIMELQSTGICKVRSGKNQFAPTTFEICDEYWPYHRNTETEDQSAYVASVRASFLALGCVTGRFGAAETKCAQDLERRGIPLALVEGAMVLGACRKYISWLNGGVLEPIQSLHYFEHLIAEIQNQPLSPDYAKYLRVKVGLLAQAWAEQADKQVRRGGYLDMSSQEIAQQRGSGEAFY